MLPLCSLYDTFHIENSAIMVLGTFTSTHPAVLLGSG